MCQCFQYYFHQMERPPLLSHPLWLVNTSTIQKSCLVTWKSWDIWNVYILPLFTSKNTSFKRFKLKPHKLVKAHTYLFYIFHTSIFYFPTHSETLHLYYSHSSLFIYTTCLVCAFCCFYTCMGTTGTRKVRGWAPLGFIPDGLNVLWPLFIF